MTLLYRGPVLLLVYLMLVGLSFAQQEAEPKGKKLFVDNKCTMCHTLTAAGITKSTMGDKSPAAKKGMGDLSKVGSFHQADFIEKYLTQKEVQEGVKHPKNFTGAEADLKELASWLATFKEKEAPK